MFNVRCSMFDVSPLPPHSRLLFRHPFATLRHMGTLYYGDNLDILRRYLKDETVDLVYLDPPFNSAQDYNAFCHEKDGTAAASQIKALEDTGSRQIHVDLACALRCLG